MYIVIQISEIFSEISVAVGTFLVTKAYYSFTEYKKYKIFRTVFGSGVVDSKNIAFSVPLWSAIKNSNRDERYNKSHFDSDGNILNSENLHGPDFTYAKSDVIGVNNVLTLINKYIKEPIEIISDDEDISSEEKSIIYIGSPIANYHAREIFDGNETITWDVNMIETQESNECLESFFFKNIDGKEFHTDNKYGYAAIYKCRLHSKYISYMIFGQHESGTAAATRYFSNKFEEIASYEDNMVIILKTPINKLKTGRTEVVYASKKRKKNLFNKIIDFIF